MSHQDGWLYVLCTSEINSRAMFLSGDRGRKGSAEGLILLLTQTRERSKKGKVSVINVRARKLCSILNCIYSMLIKRHSLGGGDARL